MNAGKILDRLSPAVLRELSSLVAASSRVGKRRARRLDEDDLRQEAWVAALLALAAWKPERGPLGPYAAVSIRRAVAAETLRELAPVSAPYKRRKELYGLGAVEVSADATLPAPMRETWTPEDEAIAREVVRIRLEGSAAR